MTTTKIKKTTSGYDKLGSKYFPTKLKITKNADGIIKNKEPVYTGNYMPKQTDFKDLTDTEIKARHKYIDKCEYLAVDTSVVYQLDIDMKDDKTYPPEQWNRYQLIMAKRKENIFRLLVIINLKRRG